MMPNEPSGQPGGGEQPAHRPIPLVTRPYRWYHKTGAVFFAAFCLGLGLFLLIFPWSDLWESNYFSTWVPEWHQYWDNMYVRGAISGIGVVNLWIAFAEVFRLRRFSK